MNEKPLKIVIMGAGAVGKSSVVLRFINNIFIEVYNPTIEDCYRTVKILNGLTVTFEILDTAGNEHFTVMRDIYISEGEGFVLVYDVTSPSSFSYIKDLYDMIFTIKNDKSTPIIICGNKCDLEESRLVLSETANRLSDDWNCDFYETSAKDSLNNERVFMSIAEKIMLKRFCDSVVNPPVVIKKKGKCTIL